MTTNYDPIAEQYKRSKQQPWRAHVEAFTLMTLIGDPAGKAVIDFACGEGFYTRRSASAARRKSPAWICPRKSSNWPEPAKPNNGWGTTKSSGPGGTSGRVRTTDLRRRLTL